MSTTSWEQPTSELDSTSALWRMRNLADRGTIVALGSSLLLGPGTGDIPFDMESLQYEVVRGTTSSNAGLQMEELEALFQVVIPHHETDQAAVCELRRLSGLTWDQIAALMGVRRRSVHFWASGKELSARNQEHLHRVLAVVKSSYKGSGAETRRALLETDLDGTNPFDLIRSGDFEGARIRLGGREGAQALRSRSVADPGQGSMGRPAGPESLVGAQQDRIHKESGRSRVPAVGRAKKKNA